MNAIVLVIIILLVVIVLGFLLASKKKKGGQIAEVPKPPGAHQAPENEPQE